MASSSAVQITDHQSNLQIIKSVTSNAISALSGGMFSYGLGLMLLQDTHSPLSFGLNILISPIVSLLFFIPIGNFVDRYHHKKILMFSYIVRLVILILLALTLNQFEGMGKLIPVSIFVMIDAFLTNLRSTAYSASVHELVNNQKISSLSSFTQACRAGSQILSPMLGILLYTLIGMEGFIQIEVLATIVAFIILLTMKFFISNQSEDEKQPTKTEASQWNDFKEGIKYINQRALIRDLIILGTVINFLFTALTIWIPFIINHQLRFPNSTIAILETGFSIGILLGSIGANFLQNKGSFGVKIFVPLLVAGGGLLLLGIVLHLANRVMMVNILGMTVMILISFAVAVLNVSMGVRLQKTVPTKLLGRVSSTLMTANQLAMPIGTVVFTLIFQFVANGSNVLIINGIITIIYVLICMPFIYNNVKQDDKDLNNKGIAKVAKKI